MNEEAVYLYSEFLLKCEMCSITDIISTKNKLMQLPQICKTKFKK